MIKDNVFYIEGSKLICCSKDKQDYINCYGERWETVDYDPEIKYEKKELIYEIVVPEGVTEIANNAFSNCSNIETVTIPQSVNHIGAYAFSNCENLSNIIIEGKDISFDPDTFKDSSFYFLTLKSLLSSDDKTIQLKRQLHPDGNDSYPEIICKPYYLFFDTETNGLPLDYSAPINNLINWPRVLQLSWIVTDDRGGLISVNDYIIRPEGFTINESAISIHKITLSKAIAEGEDIKTVLNSFISDVKSTEMIVGHNVEFDMKVVGAELLRNGYNDIFVGKRYFCTMKNTVEYCCIPRGNGRLKYPKLQELYSIIFGKEFDDAHNSLNDIKATVNCFFELKKRKVLLSKDFEGVMYYPEGWIPVETRPFTSQEIESVSKAVIVSSSNGKSVRLDMKAGGVVFFPLQPGALIGVGDTIDLNKVTLQELKKPTGETSYCIIYRPAK